MAISVSKNKNTKKIFKSLFQINDFHYLYL